MLMYRKWVIHWALVDVNSKTLNRRTREKTSEGKWTIDWAAGCMTYICSND